jgi:pimeloyl-ACP methyl ester carboxylesterase
MSFSDWQSRAQTFTHDGLSQSYTDAGGDGDVIVLFHGYPTWSYDWVDIIPALSKTHRVIAADWIGYGLSDKPKRRVTISEQIDRLDALLVHLGVDQFHLVAHDYGSSCALELVSREALAGRVKSLTLMNGGVIFEAYRPTRTQKLLISPIGALMGRLLSAKRVRKRLNELRGNTLTDDQFDALWAGMSHNDGLRKSHITQKYILERREHGARWEAALQAYPGPTQLIWGPLDPISGPHVLAPLRDLLPKAKVMELPGIGHFVPDEAPESVSRAIRDFVSRETINA